MILSTRSPIADFFYFVKNSSPAELSDQVNEAEVKATYPEPEDAHPSRVADLEGSTSAARQGVEHLTAQLQELEAQRAAVKEGLQQLVQKEKELEELIDQVEPKIRWV